MELLIVTGMSGAGKSLAANTLEDMGFFCVDNVPPAIIPSFVELSKQGGTQLDKMAIVTDARGGNMLDDIFGVLNSLKADNVAYKILFLDCDDTVLVHRFKENRRRHPLCDISGLSLTEAVEKERGILKRLSGIADYTVNTSLISPSQLKAQLSDIFKSGENKEMVILCKSFGFKYGLDADADIVFDVRCLPNPFYIEELKPKTGLDTKVSSYVMGFEQSTTFADKIKAFLDYSIPLYIKEGKSQLVVAFGCTGGRHRSVTFAELVCRHLTEKGYAASTVHRDINRGVK